MAVTVHEGNVADATTLMPEITRLKENFGITQFVMVGDRGMIGSTAITTRRDQGGIDWITALKSASIRALVEDKTTQPDLSLPAAWPKAGTGPLLPLHARLLRRVAYEGGLAGTALCLRGPGGQGRPRSGGADRTLRRGQSEDRASMP